MKQKNKKETFKDSKEKLIKVAKKKGAKGVESFAIKNLSTFYKGMAEMFLR